MRRTAMLALVLMAVVVWCAAPPPSESPERLKMRQEAQALNEAAVRLSGEGRVVDGLKAFVASLRLNQKLYPAEQFPDGHPDLATSLNNIGYVLQALGEAGKALEYHQQALAMRQKLFAASRFKDGHPDLALSLNNMGFVLQALGDPAKALEYYQQALVMRQKLYPASCFMDGHPDLARSLNNMGSVLEALGEAGKALDYSQQALAMRQKLYPASCFKDGHPDLAGSLNNMGAVLQAQGEAGKALEYHKQALAMRQKLYPASGYKDGHPELAGSLNNMGAVLQAQGEAGKALEYFQQALAMFQKLYPASRFKDGHPDLALCLNNMGSVLQAQGEAGKALKYYQQSLEMRQKLYPPSRFKDGHPLLAASLNNLGGVLEAQGEARKALEYFQQALTMFQKLYPASRFKDGHPDLAESLNNMGGVLRARGEPGKALEHCQQALAMYQKLSVQLALSASESRALNHAASLPFPRDAYLSVSRGIPGHDAYGLIWQGKAAVSRVMERRHQAALAAAHPLAREHFAHLVSLRSQRQDLLLAPAIKDTTHRDRRLRELEDQIEATERQLLRLLPGLGRLERQLASRPEELQKALPDGCVLVDLLRHVHIEILERGKRKKYTPSYVGFVVRRDRVVRVELGEAKPIEEAIEQWRQAISEGSEGKRQAQLLRRLVWEPLAKHLPVGTRVVYLSPDMALSRLPWAALPNGKGGVLLQEHALCVVPHGVFLLDRLTSKAPPGKGKATLLALGGVAYDEEPAREKLLAGLRSAPSKGKLVWDDLPGTRQEVQRLGKLAAGLEVRTLLKSNASVARLMAELPRTRYAHLATHGFFADPSFRSILQLDEKLFAQRLNRRGNIERVGPGAGNPMLLSGLVCSGANRADTAQRGILTADAVSQLDLRGLELAVLSACETGLGETAGGEGVFGLQRAFHIGGAGHVVASLWRVEDEATAALMSLFYRNLWHAEKRMTPVEALRQAQLAVYLNPQHVKEWSAGRGPRTDRVLEGSALPKGEKPARTAPLKQWAAFVVSGSGQ